MDLGAILQDVRAIREELGVNQADLADMLGVSARTVQSCEQGWRRPSPALERSLLLLLIASRQGADFGRVRCWEINGCDAAAQERCVAHRTRQGHLCWFLSGNLCTGKPMHSWEEKKRVCGECRVMNCLLAPSADRQ
jgi:DNA-binding XRE family transcriptional regulator